MAEFLSFVEVKGPLLSSVMIFGDFPHRFSNLILNKYSSSLLVAMFVWMFISVYVSLSVHILLETKPRAFHMLSPKSTFELLPSSNVEDLFWREWYQSPGHLKCQKPLFWKSCFRRQILTWLIIFLFHGPSMGFWIEISSPKRRLKF